MISLDHFSPTRPAALARVHAVRPSEYARSRNAIDGAVSGLSPYITHGLISLPDVLAQVNAYCPMDAQHKFVYELGWRAYFRHVWSHQGEKIFDNLHDGPLPPECYAAQIPADIRQAATGVPAIDQAVRILYATGYMHNHARMWLASYMVHLRKVHWRAAADWMYGHLLDGDLASNHLSWQWVAGTGSTKPYLFNADNVARYALPAWHSPGSVIDQSYEALDSLARQWPVTGQNLPDTTALHLTHIEPPLVGVAPPNLGLTTPSADAVMDRDVWLVHPWQLGDLPDSLAHDTVVIGIFVSDFHQSWPWNDKRWQFVGSRMAELTALRWQGDSQAIDAALKHARRVRSVDDPHMHPWLPQWATCEAAPALFPMVHTRCDSFSQWWRQTTRGVTTASDWLKAHD